MMNILRVIFVAFAVSLIAACSSAVQYGDATAVETVNVDFGSTDLQTIANKMVDDMLVFPPLLEVTAKKRPVLFVDKIKNKTTEHIDTESVTDSIQTKMIQSGKFRFVDMTAVEQVRKQFEFQQQSGFVDEQTAAVMGRQIGAEYMLYGNLSSIVKQDKKVKDVYYKFSLKLMHLQSGIVEWMGEKEIRKTKTKGFFGK